ncbi:fibronectin type III domain-containing protein [Thiovibrio sp. JS02]
MVGTNDEWYINTAIGAAVDSADVIHLISYNWVNQPYYQKFYPAGSAASPNTWSEVELFDTTAGPKEALAAIAIDANDAPHILYQRAESYKGSAITTVYYANKINGVWNLLPLTSVEESLIIPTIDIAVGPDNIPYIMLNNKVLKGNANNPTAFEEMVLYGGGASLAIHANGDVRLSFNVNGRHVHYLHEAGQPWSNGWLTLDSGKNYGSGTLVLVDDVPYTVFTLLGGIGIQREFDLPTWVAPASSDGTGYNYGPTPTTRWSFYNHHAPAIIDLGARAFVYYDTSYLYAKYSTVLLPDFSATPEKGVAPLTVNFTDKSLPGPGGAITFWEWDFDNDGNIDANEQNPSYVFSSLGTYSVALTVQDSAGNRETILKENHITADVDSDHDTVLDFEDNCPTIFNQTQVDLDGDGIGYACDDNINILPKAFLYSNLTQITETDPSATDVSTFLADNNWGTFTRIRKDLDGYDALGIISNLEAKDLASLAARIYVADADGGEQSVLIYAYNADGVTINSAAMLSATLVSGENSVALTSLLPAQNNFGFLKFRIVATDTWVDIAELTLTGTSAKGLDNRILTPEPGTLDFGEVMAGAYVWQQILLKNTGSEDLHLGNITLPQQDQFSLSVDYCSGQTLPPGGNCYLIAAFSPAGDGVFSEYLHIESDDMDQPIFDFPLQGSCASYASTGIMGEIADKNSSQPVSDAEVTLDMPREFSAYIYDYEGPGASQVSSVSEPIHENDETKIKLVSSESGEIVYKVRNPYSAVDGAKIIWNGIGESIRCRVLAQSFVAAKTGQLTSVSLYLARENVSPYAWQGKATVFLKKQVGGEADAILATSETLPYINLPTTLGMVNFQFPTPASVTAGETYYLFLYGWGTDYGYQSDVFWGSNAVNSYNNGTGFLRDDTVWQTKESLIFQTYVDAQLDQSYLPGNDVVSNLSWVINYGSSSSLYLYNNTLSSWELLEGKTHGPGYDDVTLTGTVRENLADYLDGDGWLTVKYQHRDGLSNPVYNLATDQFSVLFLSTSATTTDPAGQYSFSGLFAGDYELRVDKEAYFDASATGTALPGQITRHDLLLTPAPPLAVTVTSPAEGAPLTVTNLKVEGTVTNALEQGDVTQNPVVYINGQQATVYVDGTYWGWVTLVQGANPITVSAVDEFEQTASATLTVYGDFGMITGRVTDTAGLPLASARVDVSDGTTSWNAYTKADGTFSLAGMTGAVNCYISMATYTTETIPLTVAAGTVTTLPDVVLKLAAPSISSITVNPLAANSATINWTTNIAASSIIEYGTTTAYGRIVSDPVLKTTHSLTLPDLVAGTTYHFRIKGVNSDQVEGFSADKVLTTPVPFILANIAASDITGNTAVISWNTDQAADSLVEYGPTTAYGQSVTDGSLVNAHSLALAGLAPATQYHYRVISANSLGERVSSGDYLFTTQPPALISNIVVGNVTSNSATIGWTTDQPASGMVEYGQSADLGLLVSDSALVTSHSFTLDNLYSGKEYFFRVSSTNAYGIPASSATMSFTTSALFSIQILSPAHGAVLTRPDVLVRGTAYAMAGGETGVVVNGVPALSYGGEFAASHVALVEGENIITVTATDPAGTQAQESIIVVYAPGSGYVTLEPDSQSALAPMDTTLNLDTTFTMSGVPVYSGSGPGAVTYTETGTVESIMANMADPGIYYFTVEAQDEVGAVYNDTVAVLAMDKTELDALLKAKWDGMKNAIVAGDVEGGLSYFLQRSQGKYRLIFSDLLDHLPAIYSNMQAISMIYCEDGIAKYRINRTQIINGSAIEITYYIYFAVDGDGLFKIYKY